MELLVGMTPNESDLWAGDRTGKPARPATDGDAAVGIEAFLAGAERKAYRITCYALRNHELALDLVQDSMLKLVEKYASRPHHEWPALFFTILNNRITDARRSRRVRESAGKLVSLFRTPAGGDGGDEIDLLEYDIAGRNKDRDAEPEGHLANKQLRDQLERAVSTLSERQREVFLLREWQGLDVRDTARALGCSEGSVKQHHFRAMQALRQKLAEVWQDE